MQRIISERQDSGQIADEDIRKMTSILEAIFTGACQGNLERMKADLPLHYFVVDEVSNYTKVRKLKAISEDIFIYLQPGANESGFTVVLLFPGVGSNG